MRGRNLISVIALLCCVIMYGCSYIDKEASTKLSSSNSITLIPSATTSLSPPTQTPSIQLKITPIPALPVEEAEAKVLELLQTNGDCQLPCFWGLTPGLTKEESAISYNNQFLNISPEAVITIPKDDLQIVIDLYWDANDGYPPETLRWLKVITTVNNRIMRDDGYVDIANFDNPYYQEFFQYYTLSNLLSNYGQPSNIYVDLETDFVKEFYLILDYTESGWVAKLTMPMSIKDGVLEGCPAKAFTTLWLWSPEDKKTAKEYGFVGYSPLKSITEATNISLEEFYKKYQDPANAECLEIPLSVWP